MSCVNSDVVIYRLVPGFNSDCKQSWGEPTDGPIYPMGNLVRGICPTTQQNICVSVCVYAAVFSSQKEESLVTEIKVSKLYFRVLKETKAVLKNLGSFLGICGLSISEKAPYAHCPFFKNQLKQ